jgi:hypothetical protein
VHNANPKNATKQGSGNAKGQAKGNAGGKLQVGIYQIADDSLMLQNRMDNTGWDWDWADYRRDWMDETASNFAYRCLPLTIANQTGWWIRNPVGFTAVWRGKNAPGSIDFLFDTAPPTWTPWINNQFGHGVVTWNTPFLFRTKPVGSRLLILGPANSFKHAIQPLTAIIESDWISMSFTMNWKFTATNIPVRFEVGEPLFQAIPLGSNICSDLQEATVTYMKLSDDPEVDRSYREWSDGRKKFHQQKASGEVKHDSWQKDYFTGRDAPTHEAEHHMTKVKPPQITYSGTARPKS